MSRPFAVAFAAALSVSIGAPAFASDVLNATKSLSGTRVTFSMPSGYSNATLSVAGPDGRVLQMSTSSGSPSIDIGGQNAMGDGIYTYQLTAASPQTKMVKPDPTVGRDLPTKTNMRGEVAVHVSTATSGTFLVKGGRIVDTTNMKEAAN